MKKRLLSMLLSLTMLLTVVPMTAAAAGTPGGSCGLNAAWSYDADSHTLTISGTGSTDDYQTAWGSNAPWADYLDQIQRVNVSEGITRIGDGAFGGEMVSNTCTNLSTVTLPNTLVSIGDYAFGGAPISVLDLPGSLEEIGSYAFAWTLLSSIVIPAKVKTIGKDPFVGAAKLARINVAAGNPYYTSDNNILYTAGKTQMVSYPRANDLTDYRIPSTITGALYLHQFHSIQNLRSITVPASVTLTELPGYNPSEGQDPSGEFNLYFEGTVPEITDDWCFYRDGKIYTIVAQKVEPLEPSEPDTPNFVISLSTDTTIQVGTSTVVSWNQFPNATRYYVNMVNETTNVYYWKDYITYDTSLDLNLPASTYTIYVEPMDTNGTRLTKSNVITLEVSDPINADDVFIKQSTTKTCTLASSTMMLRRRAILDGLTDWNAITEAAVRKSAWTSSGMRWSFTYRGMSVATMSLKKSGYTTVAQKKNFFISMLQAHPEGFVIYNHSKPHAVLLTDYDISTDTFYCADPAGGAAAGRIPLANCTIPGSGQDAKINNIQQTWHIQRSANRKALTRSTVSSHCPVDLVFTVDDQVLDSRTVTDTASNEYAAMSVTGTGAEKAVTVQVNGDVLLTHSATVEFIGNDTGSMTYVVEHTFSDNSTETHTFQNIPLTAATTGISEGLYPQSTVLLSMSSGESNESTAWSADPDETVTQPTQDFDQIPDPADPTPTPSGGSSSSGGHDDSYVVATTRAEHGSVTVSPRHASQGTTVNLTLTPDAGYTLDTLTVTDKNGNPLKLTDKGNGKYTFIMPGCKVNVEAMFTKVQSPAKVSFDDVSSNAYYYDAVLWAVEQGITGGTSANTFSPDASCTRAQIVTFLWRTAGSPEPKGEAGFSDVSADSYYAKAVAWAVENGITSGSGANTFSPDAPCTRAQSVTFLFHAVGQQTNHSVAFTDVSDDRYYASAVAWAVDQGVTHGIGNGQFGPDHPCTRAQIITFLHHTYQK